LAQVPLNVQIQIVKSEDARRYDKTIEDLMASPSEAVRKRAALAAGRIGNDAALMSLTALMENDKVEDVRAMAAFAIGEIESAKGADAILKALNDSQTPAAVRARAVEAAGKIAAVNPKDEKAKLLGEAILDVLTDEDKRQSGPSTQVVRLGLTAVLRVRPAGADEIVRKFLAYSDPAVVADALNTLTRLKAKNANRDARDLLETSLHAVIRANAARLLGAAEDKEAVDILLKAAVNDTDSRVRVSAIRALGSLKDAKAADKLLERGEKLFSDYRVSKFAHPTEKNELLEIATTLGRILAGSQNEKVVAFLNQLRISDKAQSPETEIALAQIAPRIYVNSFEDTSDWKSLSAQYQGLAVIADLDSAKEPDAKSKARLILVMEIASRFTPSPQSDATARSRPDLVTAFAAFKSENTSNILRPLLENEQDVFVRAAIAGVLADQPASKENADALRDALKYALENDKQYNDALLATMDALAKVAGRNSISALSLATYSPDYLVRTKAIELLNPFPGRNDTPLTGIALENWRHKTLTVQPYDLKTGTKLGQVLNTEADYQRALARKNGSVKAILTTEKGTFTIDFLPEDAPLTVDNFIKLANSGYFNGVEVHRVMPNFVMQDGDPRGDGNGGPGWSIRDEINMVPYERGAVGMALSGKDTGGSQWFVTHSPQPHLDGGYTVFGKVNETGMKVVDNIV
ncbi:MAG: peptidylprolyl isomerase, partial [Pyrinomonadaceae bacterium]